MGRQTSYPTWQPDTFNAAIRISRVFCAYSHQPYSSGSVCVPRGLQHVEHVEQPHHVGAEKQTVEPGSSDRWVHVHRGVRSESVFHAVAGEGMAGRTVAAARVAYGAGAISSSNARWKGAGCALPESCAQFADGFGYWNFRNGIHAGRDECGNSFFASGIAAQGAGLDPGNGHYGCVGVGGRCISRRL